MQYKVREIHLLYLSCLTKTHDCHIILQRILPDALLGIMHKEIYVAIAELGHFFQQLCARTLKLDVLHRMKYNIPIVICKLEKISPHLYCLMWCSICRPIYLMRQSLEDQSNMGGCTLMPKKIWVGLERLHSWPNIEFFICYPDGRSETVDVKISLKHIRLTTHIPISDIGCSCYVSNNFGALDVH
jgi:hypothetical protein